VPVTIVRPVIAEAITIGWIAVAIVIGIVAWIVSIRIIRSAVRKSKANIWTAVTVAAAVTIAPVVTVSVS
jgi:hypothetical protein